MIPEFTDLRPYCLLIIVFVANAGGRIRNLLFVSRLDITDDGAAQWRWRCWLDGN
jgi:hypothetical protein